MKTYKTSKGVLNPMCLLAVLFLSIIYCIVFGIPGVPQFYEDFAALPQPTSGIANAVLLLLTILMILE